MNTEQGKTKPDGGSPGHTGSFRPVLEIFTTEGKRPRGSRGPDKGDRRSWGAERNDPGCIRQALNRSGGGQARHGPWEWVLIWGRCSF